MMIMITIIMIIIVFILIFIIFLEIFIGFGMNRRCWHYPDSDCFKHTSVYDDEEEVVGFDWDFYFFIF